MLLVRRREDHRLDLGILQDVVQAVAQLDLALAAEIFGLGARARVGCDEGDLVALALHRIDDRLSPPAQAYDGGSYHASSSVVNIDQVTASASSRSRDRLQRAAPESLQGPS